MTKRKSPAWWRGYRPQVLYVLMGINVVVYVLWQLAQRQLPQSGAALDLMAAHFTVSLAHMQQGYVWTLLTSEFSHIDPMHLAFNMLGIWVFGKAVHRVLGDLLFVHLYVVGAVLASLGHVIYQYLTGSPAPALGASGAVMAIAVVYAACFPKNKLLVFFVIPMPAAIAVAGFILLDLFGAVGQANSGIAHAAHLGGALYGLLFWALWLRTRLVRKNPVPARYR